MRIPNAKCMWTVLTEIDAGAIYTQMYQNLKGFPMRSSEPSPYYPNYAAIDKKVRDDVANATPPSTAAYVAEKLVRQIDRANPPGKLWIGTFATPVAMVFGLLELFGLIALKDWIWGKAMHCNMTLKPEKRIK